MSKWDGHANAPDGLEWVPPPANQCEERRIPTPLPGGHLITIRLVTWNGQLMEYAITYSRMRDDGEYEEITCIDTQHHGSVHRHDDGDHKKAPKILRPIRSQEDVQESFKASYDEVFEIYLSSKGEDDG